MRGLDSGIRGIIDLFPFGFHPSFAKGEEGVSVGTFAAKAGRAESQYCGVGLTWSLSLQCNHEFVVLIQSDQAFSHSLRIPGVCSPDKHNDSRVLAGQFCACYPEFCWPSSCAEADGKLVIKSFLISGISILPPLEKVNYLTTFPFEGTLLLMRSVGTTPSTCRMHSC